MLLQCFLFLYPSLGKVAISFFVVIIVVIIVVVVDVAAVHPPPPPPYVHFVASSIIYSGATRSTGREETVIRNAVKKEETRAGLRIIKVKTRSSGVVVRLLERESVEPVSHHPFVWIFRTTARNSWLDLEGTCGVEPTARRWIERATSVCISGEVSPSNDKFQHPGTRVKSGQTSRASRRV